MKTIKKLLPGIIALFLTATIIGTGAVAIFVIGRLLPDYKDTTVTLELPSGSGLYFAQQNTDILQSYPWDSLSGDEKYISDMLPDWLSTSKNIFEKCYPADQQPNLEESISYTYKDGIYFLKSTKTDELTYYAQDMSAAFLEGGRLLSFNIEASSDYADSNEINMVYDVIGKSAFSNQSTSDGLAKFLDDLTKGNTVLSEEYVYNEESGEYEISDKSAVPFSQTDPVRDFFRRYCAYCSQNGVANTDAQYIYTLIRYGTYACVYSEGQIYLMYTIADFGSLTLVWDVSSTSLCTMSLDARNVNPKTDK